jgi:hypothetical protein
MVTKKPKIFIAIPNIGTISTGLFMNCLFWGANSPYPFKIYPPENLRPVDCARNFIIQAFLNDPDHYDYLLMIDADMSVPNNLLDLCQLGKAIVSPVCLIYKNKEIIPTVLEKASGGVKLKKSFPLGTLVEVDSTGSGVLLIQRQVFENLDPPYFKYQTDENGILNLGQDFYFCEKVKKAGYKIYVHTGMFTSHFKTIDLLPTFLREHEIPCDGEGIYFPNNSIANLETKKDLSSGFSSGKEEVSTSVICVK